MRLALVSDADPVIVDDDTAVDDETTDVEPNGSLGEPFNGVIIVEDQWTGDNRYFEPGSITWRELPLPMMALDKTTEAHQEAVMVGLIESIERVGNEITFSGRWMTTPETEHYRQLNADGVLRWVSADLDDIEVELHIPPDPYMEAFMNDEDPPEIEKDEDGNEVVKIEFYKEVFTRARIMGATLLPFPAMQEAYMETPGELVASVGQIDGVKITGWMSCEPCADTVVAAGDHPIEPPMCPPAEWFPQTSPLTEVTPLTVTDDGRLFGHLAAWDSCHIGFGDKCVTPPRSTAAYQHFMTGELVCDDGSRVEVGQITMAGPHADMELGAAAAKAHYDNTCTAVADVVAGEDEYGIWIAGALRPDVTGLQVRSLLASDLSGDWRRIGSNLELVAALAVNVPGFHKPRATLKTRMTEGVVASLVASLPVVDRPSKAAVVARDAADDRAALRIARSIGRGPEQRQAEALAVAQRIGRDPDSRRDEIKRRVEALR